YSKRHDSFRDARAAILLEGYEIRVVKERCAQAERDGHFITSSLGGEKRLRVTSVRLGRVDFFHGQEQAETKAARVCQAQRGMDRLRKRHAAPVAGPAAAVVALFAEEALELERPQLLFADQFFHDGNHLGQAGPSLQLLPEHVLHEGLRRSVIL